MEIGKQFSLIGERPFVEGGVVFGGWLNYIETGSVSYPVQDKLIVGPPFRLSAYWKMLAVPLRNLYENASTMTKYVYH